jgi:hypothetical protein
MKGFATACFAIAGLLASGPAATAERPTVGQVEQVQGKARAEHAAESRDLSRDAAVLFKDLLVTGEDARLLAALADGTELTLGENAKLEIDKLIYDPGSADNSLVVNVVAGAFLFVGGRIEEAGGNAVTIRTAVVTIGVRGTTVWGGRIDDGFGVLVLNGAATVSTAAGAVALGPGQGTMIFRSTDAPDDPVVWPQQKVDRAIATVSFGQ